MTTGVKLTVTGLDEALGKMRELAEPKAVDRRINSAMKAGAKPILETAQSKVPVADGDLKRSLIINSKKLRNGNRSVRVGPSTDSFTRIKGGTRGATINLNRKKRPANYAHLVEYGTKRSKATPFMRPAAARHGGQKYLDTVAQSLGKSYARLARQKARLAR